MIGNYLTKYNQMRYNGERVVVDGNCLSACTLLLGLIDRANVCATPRARFGFHAAWMPGDDGRPVTSKLGTQALWEIYPNDVRRWITRHGGLKRQMIFMQGADAFRIVQQCGGSSYAAVPAQKRIMRNRPHRAVRLAHAR